MEHTGTSDRLSGNLPHHDLRLYRLSVRTRTGKTSLLLSERPEPTEEAEKATARGERDDQRPGLDP